MFEGFEQAMIDTGEAVIRVRHGGNGLPVLRPGQGRRPPARQAALLRDRHLLRELRRPPHHPGRPQRPADRAQPRQGRHGRQPRGVPMLATPLPLRAPAPAAR